MIIATEGLLSAKVSHTGTTLYRTQCTNGRSAGVRLEYKATIELNKVVGQCEREIQNDGAAIQL